MKFRIQTLDWLNARIDELEIQVATSRANAYASAANIVRQGCGFAPPHGSCDHEDIAVAIEGYAQDGIDGMIAALDRRREERRKDTK